MGDSEFTYRVIKKNEIPDALDIWKETGMHEGTHCLYTWFEVDPEGIRVAVTKEGTIIGVCAAIVHHGDLAFMGIYAVKEKYRGSGIGTKLWKVCYEHMGTRNGAVNAVPGKMELYRDRGGFPVEEPSWCCVVYETHEIVDPSALLKDINEVEILPIDDKVLSFVLDYDYSIFGYKRNKAISLTVNEEQSVAFVALKGESCLGYGVLKTSVQGHGLVGPLYADNKDIAEVILRCLIESLPEIRGLAFMLVSSNKEARALTEKLNLQELEECPRLYTKYALDVDLNKIYGQLDLNFSPF